MTKTVYPVMELFFGRNADLVFDRNTEFVRISQNLNFDYCFGLNLCGQNKVLSDVTVLNIIPEHSCLSVMNGVFHDRRSCQSKSSS